MPKNEVITVNTWKNDLKKEAIVQGKELANSCLLSAKEIAAKYGEYAIRRIFDCLINRFNEKISV